MNNFSWESSVYVNVGWFAGEIARTLLNETAAFYAELMRRGRKLNTRGFEIDFMDVRRKSRDPTPRLAIPLSRSHTRARSQHALERALALAYALARNGAVQ